MNLETAFLFASDLDGTLLPNTCKAPSPGCLERTQLLLENLTAQGIPVCFVTGRHLSLAKQGAETFHLPSPTWWICNVGTEIYNAREIPDADWERQLGPTLNHEALCRRLSFIPILSIQEPEKQGRHKLSFYYPEPASDSLQSEILNLANDVADGLQLIASVEESSGRALLDLIPANAGKKHAVEYIIRRYGLSPEKTFFSGDSGNDFDLLLSGVCGTLVGNAPLELQTQLKNQQLHSPEARIYTAKQHYGDGVIEGLHHYGFWPIQQQNR